MPLRQSAVLNLDLSSLSRHANSRISSPLTPGAQSSEGPSPLSPHSPKSSDSSLFTRGTTIRPVTHDFSKLASPIFPVSSNAATEPLTPGLPTIPRYSPSPQGSAKHAKDPSRSASGNLNTIIPAHQPEELGGLVDPGPKLETSEDSRDRKAQITSKRWESTPDLFSIGGQRDYQARSEGLSIERNKRQPDLQKFSQEHDAIALRKGKARFANLLSRSRSIRLEEPPVKRVDSRRPSGGLMMVEEISRYAADTRPKTALPRQYRTIKPSSSPATNSYATERLIEHNGTLRRDRSHGGSMVYSTSLSQVSDRIGKAGKGFFGKIARSGSTNEREPISDDNYVCSVVNLPIMEQARRTRIAKRLADCRDKTEFWMPALPYRCVDYLNFKGCEEEGLYRVPGSGREVKYWQRRFDTDLDVDLFEEPDLYDINTIGSLFKAWLRELPDELFPRETQAMIAEKCQGATTAPQLLRDELSKLPPYNYYILFAITCHLNLLHSYVDQNKMDYRNLCICFQPCMKVDAFCFYFLVCDWKNCWQGCWTEKEYIRLEMGADKREKAAKTDIEMGQEAESESQQALSGDEAIVSSSGSSQHEDAPAKPAISKGNNKHRPSFIDLSHSRSVSQLPELGPPLSPIQI